uniref:Uncharacterized protein n=1 Tax=Oryza glaberrima TaxID=4538 RepID=I1NNA1_ORYGL
RISGLGRLHSSSPGSCRLSAPLLRGSAVAGDGRGGSNDLFLGRLHSSSFGSHRFSAPLSCGSVGGGDGRGGSGDHFPSRIVPVVSPPPSLSHGSAAGDDGRDGPCGLSYGDDGDGFQEVSMSTTRPSASSGLHHRSH